ncbi:MAG: hypothetical protein K940chlam6_00713 [Chlamydiae bacterium]|nr:hypothetical protein [Chlamydiota bacterium]
MNFISFGFDSSNHIKIYLHEMNNGKRILNNLEKKILNSGIISEAISKKFANSSDFRSKVTRINEYRWTVCDKHELIKKIASSIKKIDPQKFKNLDQNTFEKQLTINLFEKIKNKMKIGITTAFNSPDIETSYLIPFSSIYVNEINQEEVDDATFDSPEVACEMKEIQSKNLFQ